MLFEDKKTQGLAIGLAALAGFIDALGFISLSGVFVSFMSGNSTRFAVGLHDQGSWQVVLMPLFVIGVFVAGVMLGRIIRHFVTLKPSASILFFMTMCLLIAGITQELGATGATIFLMVIAMGAANNIFIKNGEVSIPVTYVTGTLVRLGQRLAGRMLGDKDSHYLPYLFLWAGLISGAILGAFAYSYWGLHSLWGGIALCIALTLFCYRSETKETSQRS
jgi:uncharacterized membrane protein YoaK (UPF0700 family)